MKTVLRVPGYRRLLAAYALNELAWSVGNLLLSLLVYRRTGSALASTGFFLASQFFPAFVAPNVVARVGHHNARRILVVLYGLQAAVFLLLAAAPSHFALVPVLAVVLVGGSLGLTARPILRATVVGVISPPGLLRQGNAVINVAFALSILLGPLIGSGLVMTVGTTLAVVINAAIFVVMALTVWPARDVSAKTPEPVEPRLRVRAALRRANQDLVVRRILLVQAAALVFFAVSSPVEVILAQHALHAGAGGYAALLSAWGSGAIVGSAIYARWHTLSARLLIALGSILIGVGFLLMAAAPTIVLAVVGSVIGGIGNGIEAVAERTALQERVEQRWMALTMSLNDSMFQALPGLGFVLGGLLAELAGPRLAFVVGGIGAVGVGVLAPLMLRTAPGSPAPVPTPGSALASDYSNG